MWAQESDTLLGDVGQFQEADHLKAATVSILLIAVWQSWRNSLPSAISQDIMLPSLELVSSAHLLQHILSWLQAQVVCVV